MTHHRAGAVATALAPWGPSAVAAALAALEVPLGDPEYVTLALEHRDADRAADRARDAEPPLEPSTDDVVAALLAAGITARPEWCVPEVVVTLDGLEVLLCRGHNRDGWESAYEVPGKAVQTGGPDGPDATAGTVDVVAWVVQLLDAATIRTWTTHL